MDKDLAEQVVDVAARVVASGAISHNGHGNVSLRVPGSDEMYFTAGPSLRGHPVEAVVRVGLDGELREGDLPPVQRAVVAMHTAMYADRPEVGCVLHTHSPFATAYAVARRPIGCWVEALAMFGLPDGVPVAGYGPRGSAEAVAHIRAAVRPGVPAVLLANHGVLVFHRTPELAIMTGGDRRGGRAGRHQRGGAGRSGRDRAADARGGAATRDGVRPGRHRPRLTCPCDSVRVDDETLTRTRRCLHGVAETLLAGPQHRTIGRIRLRVTRGGFSTLDLPGSPSRIAVEGTDLVVVDADGDVHRHALAGTYRELGAAAGIDAGSPEGVYPDGSGVGLDDVIVVDAAAATAPRVRARDRGRRAAPARGRARQDRGRRGPGPVARALRRRRHPGRGQLRRLAGRQRHRRAVRLRRAVEAAGRGLLGPAVRLRAHDPRPR